MPAEVEFCSRETQEKVDILCNHFFQNSLFDHSVHADTCFHFNNRCRIGRDENSYDIHRLRWDCGRSCRHRGISTARRPGLGKNLRQGTGIGLILGLGFGIYDGFVLYASRHERYALLNIESHRIAWSVPRLVMTSDVPSDGKSKGLFDFRFDALRYRF